MKLGMGYRLCSALIGVLGLVASIMAGYFGVIDGLTIEAFLLSVFLFVGSGFFLYLGVAGKPPVFLSGLF